MTLKRIDEQRLEQDLEYRFGYLTEFMGFSPQEKADLVAFLRSL